MPNADQRRRSARVVTAFSALGTVGAAVALIGFRSDHTLGYIGAAIGLVGAIGALVLGLRLRRFD